MSSPILIFEQLIEWLCKKLGARFLWHLPLKSNDFSTQQLPPKDLLLADFGKKAGDFDLSSESFKHRFLAANRSWLIQQLRGALGQEGSSQPVNFTSVHSCARLFMRVLLTFVLAFFEFITFTYSEWIPNRV